MPKQIKADLDQVVEAIISELQKTHYETVDFEHDIRHALEQFVVQIPSSEMIEANGKEGGLRDGELQMFWEGATWMRDYIMKMDSIDKIIADM